MIGWLIRLERRQGGFLTGKGHRDLHVDENARLERDLEEIKAALRDQNYASSKHRFTVLRQLAAIERKVAVVETKLNERRA